MSQRDDARPSSGEAPAEQARAARPPGVGPGSDDRPGPGGGTAGEVPDDVVGAVADFLSDLVEGSPTGDDPPPADE